MRYVADGRQVVKRKTGTKKKVYAAGVEDHVTSRTFMQKWCHLSLSRRAQLANH